MGWGWDRTPPSQQSHRRGKGKEKLIGGSEPDGYQGAAGGGKRVAVWLRVG